MKQSNYLIFVLFFLSGIFASANADKSTLFSQWQFSSGTTQSGKHFCSIISAVSNKNIGQNIVIKGIDNSNNLIIDLYKDKWNRPQGSNVKVMFDFVDNQPITLNAYADAHILDIELPAEYTASFLLELAQKSALQVILPDEEEATWVVTSKGAKAAIQKMVSCLKNSKV